jgi:hypothetical protein
MALRLWQLPLAHLSHVLSLLPLDHRVCCAATCTQLRAAAADPTLWQRLCMDGVRRCVTPQALLVLCRCAGDILRRARLPLLLVDISAPACSGLLAQDVVGALLAAGDSLRGLQELILWKATEIRFGNDDDEPWQRLPGCFTCSDAACAAALSAACPSLRSVSCQLDMDADGSQGNNFGAHMLHHFFTALPGGQKSLRVSALDADMAQLVAEHNFVQLELSNHILWFGQVGVFNLLPVLAAAKLSALCVRQHMDHEAAGALVEALLGNDSVAHLHLYDAHMDDDDVGELARLLTANSALRVLSLGSSFSEWSELYTTNVSADAASALADALTGNTSLTSLDLAHHELGCDGAQHIAHALCSNSTLTALRLSACEIQSRGAAALGRMLVSNSTLKTLDLSGNLITSSNVLAAGLARNACLLDLNLSKTRINDAGAKALAAALRNNSTLSTFSLTHDPACNYWYSKPGWTAALAFRNALLHNASITSLTLDDFYEWDEECECRFCLEDEMDGQDDGYVQAEELPPSRIQSTLDGKVIVCDVQRASVLKWTLWLMKFMVSLNRHAAHLRASNVTRPCSLMQLSGDDGALSTVRWVHNALVHNGRNACCNNRRCFWCSYFRERPTMEPNDALRADKMRLLVLSDLAYNGHMGPGVDCYFKPCAA